MNANVVQVFNVATRYEAYTNKCLYFQVQLTQKTPKDQQSKSDKSTGWLLYRLLNLLNSEEFTTLCKTTEAPKRFRP